MSSEIQQIVGQGAVAAAASVDIIAPGAGKTNIVSSLWIHNPNAGTATVDIYARKANAAKAAATKIIGSFAVGAGQTEIIRMGGAFKGDAATPDKLTVDATTNGVTVTAFGSEVTL